MSQYPYPMPPTEPTGPSRDPQATGISTQDWRLTAIAIMTTVGGGVALIFGVLNLLASLFVCVTIITAVYSIVVGVLCLVKGIPMLNQPLAMQTPPHVTAILQIINIVACDPINLVLGIATLALLSEPDVKEQFCSPHTLH